LAARSLAACLAATALSIAPALAAENPKTTYVCQMANHHMATQGLDKEYDKPGICAADGMELIAKNSRLRVAVLVFDGVQDIDYAGPMEVFGQSGATIFTVAANTEPVRSTFGIRMQPDFDIAHAPAADIVLVPGGNVGTVTRNPLMMDWLRQRSGDARAVLSVCTGAFILGKAGLLDGLSATTIAGATELLAQSFPKAHVVNDRRFVDNGRIITTGGLSAGLDGALHVIDREVGRLRAEDIARGMEYAWQPDGQGGFGLLAGNQIPDLAKILPPGITWERTADRGDNQQWEVSGRIEITSSTQVFLTDSSARIAADAWVELKDGNALQRSFVKTKDGKSWQLTLTLASAGVPAAYQLLLAVKQVS
jgi:putative intracellular protease/amidase